MCRYDVICTDSFVPEMWMLRYPANEAGKVRGYAFRMAEMGWRLGSKQYEGTTDIISHLSEG